MSFLQLVLSLDKTIKEIILLWRICQFDRYRNISLSLKNVMFVMSVIAQLVLGRVFCGNQSNCRNCRICILIGECWNGVDSLEILEHCRIYRIAWKGWKVMNDWNVWNVSGATGVTGVPLEGLVAGMPGMSLEGLVRHTDAFLEDLLAFYA